LPFLKKFAINGDVMKLLSKVLGIVFGVLTICGVAYVIYNDGTVSAGYAVIPMLFSLNFINIYRVCKKRDELNEK